MDTYLRCKVGLGQFSGEVAVQAAMAGGEEFSLFVSDEYVDYEGGLAVASSLDGWLRVQVLAAQSGLLLVQLPGETFENGRTVTVEKTEVQQRTPQQKV